MKLVTYESGDQNRVGVIDGEYVVDVNAALMAIARGEVRNQALNTAARRLRERTEIFDMIHLLAQGEGYSQALGLMCRHLAAETTNKEDLCALFTPLAPARLRAPIARPPKIVCVGLNY